MGRVKDVLERFDGLGEQLQRVSTRADNLLAGIDRGEGTVGRAVKDPKVYADQLTRMLADPKSEALVRNFAGQWLRLRELEHAKTDAKAYPDADKNLT